MTDRHGAQFGRRGLLSVRLERPIVCAIRERLSNTILFVGKSATLER
ncbi:MAG: hypothetical protein ACR2OG_16370 [Gemmatimonadaceae bacterium]